MTVFEKEEYFDYLDNLRESGVTNMFGASPYLQEAFDLTKIEARGKIIIIIKLVL